VNYYKRNIGDFTGATAHLSQGQVGAYDLLLDWYYKNETPLPLDMEEVYRIGKCYQAAERKNVDKALSFFVKGPDGYHHKRADEEIEKASVKAESDRENGKKGGRPPKSETQKEPNVNPMGFENGTQTKGTPDSITPDSKKDQKTAPDGDLLAGVDPQVARDFTALRNKLRAPITATAVAGIKREADKAGLTLNSALAMCCERGWRGFKADWAKPDPAAKPAKNRVML